jgi:choline dehydrogenase-like flavoprotein
MIVDAKVYENAQALEADVCIMGGGVAGIVLATELKNYFSNIILIESGDEFYTQEAQDLYTPSVDPKIYANPKYSRLRFLGGASNHWLNNTSPLSPIDFEKREWLENSGWPITFEDLKEYYDKAAQYCGTKTGNYDRGYWQNKLNQKNVFGNSEKIEFGIAKAATPPIRFFANYGKQLKESNSVTVIKNANVIDLEFDENLGKVETVTFNAYNKINHKVTSKLFIMCFGGIENARMLLHFNKKYNNKLGNKFDNVGRYFMDHPTMKPAQLFTRDKDLFNSNSISIDTYNVIRFMQLTEDALYANKTTNLRMPAIPANNYQLSDGISSFHILKQALNNGESPDDIGSHIGNLFGDLGMVIEAVSRQSFDEPLFDSADEFGGYELNIMMEQGPDRANRVKLGENKDQYGISRVEIEWELKEADINRLWKSLEVLGKDVGALSLGRLRLLKEQSARLFNDQMGFGHHHMGTTRMSESDIKGVVDKHQKVFGTSNFYISGCSVFPTSGHVPPTLTIVALSLRLAKHIIGKNQNDKKI